MKYNCTVLFLILLTPLICRGQVEASNHDSLFLQRPHVLVGLQYSKVIEGDVLPSNGVQMLLGYNLARSFKKNFVFGPIADLRFGKIGGSNSRYSLLTDDVNEYLVTNHSSAIDSARANILTGGFNQGDFRGAYYISIGLMLSPFPDNYGGLLLQAKIAKHIFPIYGSIDNSLFTEHENQESIDLEMPTIIRYELSMKPLTLFKRKHPRKLYEFTLRDNFFFSVYYQKVSIENAKLDGVALNRFLSPKFFDVHGSDDQIGVTIAVGIY